MTDAGASERTNRVLITGLSLLLVLAALVVGLGFAVYAVANWGTVTASVGTFIGILVAVVGMEAAADIGGPY